ncbi:MAG TPA: acyltransferase [Acidimicrobiia bacterium]|nr:acyltransferase [Acidimicrobiia bacterium]
MTSAASIATTSRTNRQRGLDGLRGLAVIAVLLFHQGFGWARGGYLGVSLFFTLSGFLIARLLIDEVERTGGLRLGAFWGRRLRRLAPAALLALLIVCVYGATFATDSQLLALRGDLWSSIVNVTNWRFVSSHNSYADLFQDPSPLQHFWSLAIEEQFYVVFPLLVAGIAAILVKLGRSTHFRRSLGVIVVALMGASLLEQVAFGSVDRIYYGTDTRALELLAGVLLACCWTPKVAQSRTAARVAGVAGAAALVGVLALWSTVGFGTPWLFDGGLALVALVGVVVIVAATVPGPVRVIGSWRPLVAVGLVSYGLYLYHWPVFLVLDPARTGLQGWALFGVRCAVTAALAVGSYFLLELPFRKGAIGRVRVAPVMWVAALVAVAVAVPLTVPLADPTKVITNDTFDRAEALVTQQQVATPPDHPVAAEPAAPVDPAAPAAPAVAGPAKVYVVGDSTGIMFAAGLSLYARRTGALEVRSAAVKACPMGQIDKIKWYNADGFTDLPTPQECLDAPQRWASDLAAWRPDMIVVVGGPMDSSSLHRVGDPDDRWLLPTDPAGRAVIQRGVDDVSRALQSDAPGVPQLWLTSPYILRLRTKQGETVAPGGPQEPAFTDVYNAALARLATTTQWVTTVPWADAMNAEPPSEDAVHRLDGVHIFPERIVEMLDEWYPKLVAARDSVVAKDSLEGAVAARQWASGEAEAVDDP